MLLTLPEVGVVVIAGVVAVVYLTAAFLVGHVVTLSHSLPLPTLSQAYALISIFSNPTIGRKMLGHSLEVCGLESSI